MITYTILIYLSIAVIGNLAYFIGYNDNYPDCGTLSIVFFNIALLCQLLPRLTIKNNVEKNQKNGQHLLASVYLGIEIIAAFFCISKDTSVKTACIIQLVLLGIFLASLFGMARAIIKTNESLKEFKGNRSTPLLEANAVLGCGLTQAVSPFEKNILREIMAELNTIPSTSNHSLLEIDQKILSKANMLCSECTQAGAKELSMLINRRKTMMMIFNQ